MGFKDIESGVSNEGTNPKGFETGNEGYDWSGKFCYDNVMDELQRVKKIVGYMPPPLGTDKKVGLYLYKSETKGVDLNPEYFIPQLKNHYCNIMCPGIMVIDDINYLKELYKEGIVYHLRDSIYYGFKALPMSKEDPCRGVIRIGQIEFSMKQSLTIIELFKILNSFEEHTYILTPEGGKEINNPNDFADAYDCWNPKFKSDEFKKRCNLPPSYFRTHLLHFLKNTYQFLRQLLVLQKNLEQTIYNR